MSMRTYEWSQQAELQKIWGLFRVEVEARWTGNLCTYRVYEDRGSATWTSTTEELAYVRAKIMAYVVLGMT